MVRTTVLMASRTSMNGATSLVNPELRVSLREWIHKFTSGGTLRVA